MDILTVSQLNRYVKSRLQDDFRLRDLFLQGEISNLKCQMTSGHLYFTLKDKEASVQAVMWRSAANNLMFMPENGMNVIVRCTVSLYEVNGSYQIYVNDIQPNGAGKLCMAYEQLLKKLSDEGLFDERHKKPIPRYPERVAVITSPSGAVINDIKNVTQRRYPFTTIIVCPCNVQGKGAAQTIIRALEIVDKNDIADLAIIARGGGSLEDLWEYNNEELARAIFNCKIPVVSGVGHETDYTICDMVSDLRAPTPSAAAELVFPDINDVKYLVSHLKKTITDEVFYNISSATELVKRFEAECGIKRFDEYLKFQKQEIEGLKKNIKTSQETVLERCRNIISTRLLLAEEQSPLRLLQKGYSITKLGNQKINSSSQVKSGDEITTVLFEGEIKSKVI